MKTSAVFTVMFIFLSSVSSGQPEDKTYTGQNKQAISDIVDGNIDQAIAYSRSYQDRYPGDLESLFCLAVAYAAKNDVDSALICAVRSVEYGLPVERYLAGPRSLLKPLTESEGFLSFIEGRYHRLVHGPMLGNVTDSQASIWVRTSEPAEVKFELADISNLKQKIVFISSSTAEDDYTAVITATGLTPSTGYKYTVYVDGSIFSRNGIFRTYPRTTESSKIKIAFGGGAGYTPWNERIWDTLATHGLDAMLLLGDNEYIDDPARSERQQYCYYRRHSRPEFRNLISQVPVYAIYDDHDFGTNDCIPGPEIEKPAWKRQVWNVFRQNFNNPSYGGGEKQPGCWFDFYIGDVHIIMLDGRYYRQTETLGRKGKFDPDGSMLGPVQKEWLKNTLKQSRGKFIILASPVPWAVGTVPDNPGANRDKWDGFPNEREEIYSFIEANRKEGVIFVSADRHRSDAWKTERPDGYPFYDFQSSRLTNFVNHLLISDCLFGYHAKPTFGLLTVDTTPEDPVLSYSIYSIDNELIHKISLFRSELSFDDQDMYYWRYR